MGDLLVLPRPRGIEPGHARSTWIDGMQYTGRITFDRRPQQPAGTGRTDDLAANPVDQPLSLAAECGCSCWRSPRHRAVGVGRGAVVACRSHGAVRHPVPRPAEHLPPHGQRRRTVCGANRERSLQGVAQARTQSVGRRLGRRHQLIAAGARRRLGHRPVGQTTVQHGAQRIDVGPGSLPRVSGILFERRVAVRHYSRETARPIAERPTRRTEVEQYRRAVGVDHDVARLDVTVQVSRRVHLLQSVNDRQDECERPLFVQRSLAGQPRRQCLAVDVGHHDVMGSVRFEITDHAHDVRVAEASQDAPLVPKALQSPPEGVLVVVSQVGDHPLVVLAHGALDREVLLDGHLPTIAFVHREVGDAEAAASEDPSNAVMRKPMASRQYAVVARHAPIVLFAGPNGSRCDGRTGSPSQSGQVG